jgi:DNA polymerase-1
MNETRDSARERGFVSTVLGRRLYLPEITSRNHQQRQYAERSAINAPMQGTAADIIKRAMLLVDKWIMDERLDARLIMQVHDELILEVSEDSAKNLAPEVARIMETSVALDAQLKVGWGLGANWDEAH